MLPNWKPTAYAAGAILLVLIGVYSLGYRMGQAKVLGVATQAEMEAREAKGEADALKQTAMAKDAKIAGQEASLAESRTRVERANAELARLRKLAEKPNESTPIVGQLQPDNGYTNNLIDLSIAKDKVIEAQVELIHQQDTKISALEYSRDAWRGSAEAREREAAGLRIALEAQKSLTRGALWKGRFQGLAIGLGCGYLAGKR